MKLQNEIINTIQKMELIKHKIPPYAKQLKESGDYNDFETRLAWDVLRASVGSSTICKWYEQYKCNDKHIDTLAKKCLKAVYTIE